MTGGPAPGVRARRIVAAAGVRRRDRRVGLGRLPDHPVPLRVPAWAVYSKDDVFGLCDVLARAEQALIRAGEGGEAARVAAAFDVLESGLV